MHEFWKLLNKLSTDGMYTVQGMKIKIKVIFLQAIVQIKAKSAQNIHH